MRFSENKHLYLLFFLVLFLAVAITADLAAPAVSDGVFRILFLAVFGGVLLTAAYSEKEKALAFDFNAVVLAFALVFNILCNLIPIVELRASSLASSITFLGIVMFSMLRRILTVKRISGDIIYAAICVYMMIGVTWSLIYSLLELAIPMSFLTPSGSLELDAGQDSSFHTLYFSFVTLTTLGYGEITPATSPARFFTIIEALIGQMYLAVLVARLVGLQIATTDNLDSG